MCESARCHAIQAELSDGFRERACESRSLRDRREVRELMRAQSRMDDACGERLSSQAADGHERVARHRGRRELGGQLYEC